MSATLIATLAGLVTALSWGTSDWLAAKSTKKLDPLEINFALQIAGIVIMGGLWLVSDVHLPSNHQLFQIGLGTVLITAAYLLFVKALASGAVGIVVPLGNIYPVFTVLFSILFLTTRFSLGQLGAMAGIVAGSALLAYEKNPNKVPLKDLHRETLLALGAAVTWGVAFYVLNPVSTAIPWQTLSITVEVFMTIYACFLLVAVKRSQLVTSAKRALSHKPALLTGVIGTIGGAALYLGANRAGSIIIPTVLSAGGPLVASVWGAVIDKEKIGVAKRIGAVIVVGSIVVLNIA